MTSTSLLLLQKVRENKKRAVFKLKKIEIRKNMTESQEKPLATYCKQ
jgi:hypothetical protein